jgi:Amidase
VTSSNPAWIRRVEWGAEPVTGPLHGLRFAIKDNIDLIGYPTTAACPDLATRPAATVSAVAVQRLVDAGAVPAGKTNLDQFATGLVGTRSPYGACHSAEPTSGSCADRQRRMRSRRSRAVRRALTRSSSRPGVSRATGTEQLIASRAGRR